jgi:hypothetical protein
MLREIEADTEKGLTYLKWMAVCEALDEARKEAKEEVGLANSNLPTHRLGGGYNKAFGAILKREKLNSDIVNPTTRSHAFSVIEHRDEIEAYRKVLAKKDPAKRANLNHPSSVWRAFSSTPEYRAAHPKPATSTWGNRPTPTQPLTEEQLRARSGMKPSAQHIEKAAQKQAAEAEAEAKKLSASEAEVDKLRERVRRAEMAKSALESEVEELKARPAEISAIPQTIESLVTTLVTLWQDLSQKQLKVASKQFGKLLSDRMTETWAQRRKDGIPVQGEALPKKGKAKSDDVLKQIEDDLNAGLLGLRRDE